VKPIERPLLVALCISAVFLTIVVISPLSTDDLVYRSMALDLYRFGKIPYLGSWDQNFPGIIPIQYLAILLFGGHDIGVHCLDVILQFGFAILFYKFCRIWLREQTSAIAVVLYIFYYVSGRGSLYSERDVYGVMIIVSALYFILRGHTIGHSGRSSGGGRAYFLLAGLLAGYSILIRPSFVLAYLLLAAYLLSLQKRKNGVWTRWQPILLYCIAGMLPLLVLLLFYASIPGGLEAFYLATIRFNLDVYAALHGSVAFQTVLLIFLGRGLLIPLALLCFIAMRKHSRSASGKERFFRAWSNNERLLYWSLLLSFLLIAAIQQNYLAYHFAPFYLLLCPFSAIGVEWALEHVRGWFARIGTIVVVGFLYIFFMVGDRSELAGFVQALISGGNPLTAAYAQHHSSPDFGAVPEHAVLRYLSLPGNDTGSVEVCSFEPMLRVHLNRKFAGRYILPTAIALGMKGGTLAAPRYTDYQIAWRQAYMDSLRKNKPQFIILARNTAYWYLHDPYWSYLHNLPGFDSLLLTSYRYDTAFGCYQIFRRKQ
jgi:4-amino-4-deoxy-L-arabinose transferase-like glycosyltransferase